MSPPSDYYTALGVAPGSEDIVIHAAYRALMKKYHPDTFTGDRQTAERKAKEINEAHAVLSDAKKRAAYDAKRLSEQQAAASKASKPEPKPGAGAGPKPNPGPPPPKPQQSTKPNPGTPPPKPQQSKPNPPDPPRSKFAGAAARVAPATETYPPQNIAQQKSGLGRSLPYAAGGVLAIWICWATISEFSSGSSQPAPPKPPPPAPQNAPTANIAQPPSPAPSQPSTDHASSDDSDSSPPTPAQAPADVNPSSNLDLRVAVFLALDTGAIQGWTSASTGFYGRVQVGEPVTYDDGRVCRSYHYTVNDAGQELLSPDQYGCHKPGDPWTLDVKF